LVRLSGIGRTISRFTNEVINEGYYDFILGLFGSLPSALRAYMEYYFPVLA